MLRLAFSVLVFGMLACGQATLTPTPGGHHAEVAEAAALVEADTFVSRHGFLSVHQGQIVSESLEPVQLKGMSLFWSQWSTGFWQANTVATLARDWKATVVRAAMGIEHGGYLEAPEREKARVQTVVDAAVREGIYVIIDWHDHNAHQHRDAAIRFFGEMAARYRSVPNVIFEVFNEPTSISWPEVKSYAEAVIRSIREQGAKNLVIVGSPEWSQRVDLAAQSPLADANTAYALHFYASTHRGELRAKADLALGRGLALMVTEFGTCEASGNGRIDYSETDIWLNYLDQKKIGWANWSLHDKNESASALRPGVNPSGPWNDNDLSASGRYIKNRLARGAVAAQP